MVATTLELGLGSTTEAERKRLLRIYLEDNLSILTGAVELAERCYRQNQRLPLGAALKSLSDGLREEARAVRRIGQSAGASGLSLGPAAAWLAEKFGRLKTNGHLVTYSPLSRVYELEGLLLSTCQREQLWKTLAQLPDLPGTTEANERLERARGDRQLLEQLLDQAANVALIGRD